MGRLHIHAQEMRCKSGPDGNFKHLSIAMNSSSGCILLSAYLLHFGGKYRHRPVMIVRRLKLLRVEPKLAHPFNEKVPRRCLWVKFGNEAESIDDAAELGEI